MNGKLRPARRVTEGGLTGNFGADRGRQLIVSLEAGDVIVLKPKGTRRPETIHAFDVYRMAVRARVNRDLLEKARESKERKKARRAARRIEYVDRKLSREKL